MMSMTIPGLLRKSREKSPEREAINCKACNIRLTYRELDQRVNNVCAFLSHKKLKRGERIAIIAPNCHVHPELILVAARGGWVLVEIDHRLTASEIKHIIRDSEPRLVFTQDIVASDFVNCGIEKEEVIRLGREYEKIAATPSGIQLRKCLDRRDIITLMYTSGTTGRAKGVIYTHQNLAAAVANMAAMLDVSKSDKALHTSPFSHIAPIWPFLLHCHYCASNVIIDNVDPVNILSTIQKERITTWNTVPLMIARILEFEEKNKFDISSLRCITYGASSISVPTLKKALNFFGPILNQVYGTTEVYIITMLQDRDHLITGNEREIQRLRSCGLPVKNTDTFVIKSNGERIKAGEIGEVVTRGDHVSPGYWRNEKETKKSMKNGFFYTGDLATLDEDDYIYIVGRKKEIIISGGENVSPIEIENVLCEHDAVREAAVVGIPHKKWGEAVVAFILLEKGQKIKQKDLMAFCAEKLSGYKKPKQIVFLKDFPRTGSGKTLKRKLQEEYKNKVF